jgi:hypothetical protein
MTSALCLAIALLAGPGTPPSDATAGAPSLFDATPWAIAAPGQAAPQDEQEFVRKTWLEHGPFSESGYLYVGLLVRETMIWGNWYDNGLEDDDYGDLFKPGTGLVGEIGGMIPYREDWRVGLYLSFGWDTYDGDTVTPSGGPDIKPDEMVIFTGLLGARGMVHFAEIFYLEGHVAGGAAYYQDVDVTVGTVDGELFAGSVKVAGEVGARFGIELVYIQIEIGVGFRYQGGPDRGADAANEVHPDPMSCFFIELGGAIRF